MCEAGGQPQHRSIHGVNSVSSDVDQQQPTVSSTDKRDQMFHCQHMETLRSHGVEYSCNALRCQLMKIGVP